ncbi:MAG: D-alanyl-D-alanine carboxypeptidase [Clostridia bacterium]|nr:D-alanyl-D-alanine carboxypeptidase [Clostridia bacterium]
MSFCKKLVSFALCLLLLASCFCIFASAESPSLSAKSAILIDASGGRILYEKNAREVRPMASTTKIMTALVALSLADPGQEIIIPTEAVGTEGSSAYLKAGEVFTLEELLYALLLQSANDAAVAIAVSLSGSVGAFVEEMNRKAASLGLADTQFETPSGLDGTHHHTTAYDLAMLTRVALQNPILSSIVSTKTISLPANETRTARSFVNHNKLLFSYPGCIGVKTGFTKKSGRCLVSAAERDGVRLIAVTLDAPDDWNDHKELLDYGFSVLQQKKICQKGDLIAELPLVGGGKSTVTLEAADDLSLTLPKDTGALKLVNDLPPFAYAPLTKGERVGALLVYETDSEGSLTLVGSVDLIASQDYPAKKKPSLFSRLFQFFKTLFQKE